MHRMISFNMGRGQLGETSEFVTRRTCFSFTCAVSFLCLLGGFLLGRFVSDHTLAMREQRLLEELVGNGINGTKERDLQLEILDILNASTFHEDYNLDSNSQQGINKLIRDIFLDLSNVRLNVINDLETGCTIGTICGTEEHDRYVVLSASGEGLNVAINVAKTLENMYKNKGWEPKRTLIFCVFLGSTDYCSDKFLDRIKPKIVAYIAVHGNAARGDDEIVVSGSGMVQATILDAMKEINFYHKNTFKGVHSPNSLPRLNLEIPHAVLSFLNPNSTSRNVEQNQKILAQIVGLTMWRLSEEVFLQWNPQYLNDIMSAALTTIQATELITLRDDLNQTVTNLTDNIKRFNLELKNVNIMQSLEVRMMNDRLIDLDRALLCLDMNLQSKTDFTKFRMFPIETANIVKLNLNEISNCYKIANQIVIDQAYCKSIFKHV